MISLLWLFLMFNPGVTTQTLSNVQQTSVTQGVPSDTLITLKRGGCEGTCAIYSLKVSADGRVVYVGKQFVRNRGRVVSKISQEQLRELISEFDKVNYFSLRDSYQHVSDGCSTAALDYPSATTSIRVNGRSKTIFHDYGCRERLPDGTAGPVYPKELFELEQRIDEIAGTTQWVR